MVFLVTHLFVAISLHVAECSINVYRVFIQFAITPTRSTYSDSRYMRHYAEWEGGLCVCLCRHNSMYS